MADLPQTDNITYFAETDFRGKRTKFGIKDEDRSRHIYVIGKTGMGKSTLLENMAVQDILRGNGLALMDPHGATAEKILGYVPPERLKDVIYFAPFDLEHPISFNVMEDVGKDQRHLVVNGLMSAFKKIWGTESWSDRMAYILTNILLALLEYPDSTLLGVNRMIADKEYRKKVIDNVKDPSVKSYWTEEFAKYTERFAAEAVPAIQNKIGQFTNNPLIRNIIGQPKSSFNFRDLMDKKKVLIVNLSKGQVGEDNANLLGAMLITKIYLAAMSRANVSPVERGKLPPFYLYVDEFQSFANESFANILSEARKYKLSLTMAHQYVEQMSEEVRAAVFGNVGTTISFRVGPLDAEIFERIFNPTFTQEDMVNLGFAQIYLSLMINGVGSMPFSAVTLPPIADLAQSNLQEIVNSSQQLYAKPRAVVESEISQWYGEAKKLPGLPNLPTEKFKPKPPVKVTPEKVTAPPNYRQPEKVVSLEALRVVKPEKASGKHSADLREVLKEIQKESSSALSKTSSPPPKVVNEADKSKPDATKGVSEEVLRRMLET